MVDLGYNYRIDEIRAALGLVQLDKLIENNRRRKHITEMYWQAFSDLGIGLPFWDVAGESAYHIFPILLPEDVDRRGFMDQLCQGGVQTSIHYPPIHQFRYYRQRYGVIHLPKTESTAQRQVTLPLYPTMSEDQINLVISAVQDAVLRSSS